METIALPTKECRGVDVPDAVGNPSGQVYRARKDHPGYIEVGNARHAKAIRTMLGQDSIVSVGFKTTHTDEGTCADCGRRNWDWMKVCAKCGASLAEVPA